MMQVHTIAFCYTVLNYLYSVFHPIMHHTAHSDTIFSHTYIITCEVNLIEDLQTMDQMGQSIYQYIKPETNKGNFRLYFELVEKSCRGRHYSEILKTNTKTLIYSRVLQKCKKFHMSKSVPGSPKHAI